MQPSEQIDELVRTHADWRGALLAEARRMILEVDPGIVEEWKWMGAPVWELDGILVVGNIFKTKVKLGFMYGASLDDPHHIFNGELGGNQRRSYELYEGDELQEEPFKQLVRAAIERNRARPAKPARKTVAKKTAATTAARKTVARTTAAQRRPQTRDGA